MKVIYLLVASAIGWAPAAAMAGDLAFATHWVERKVGTDHLVDDRMPNAEDRSDVIAMIQSRDTLVDRPLDSYDCARDTRIDKFWGLRSFSHHRWADRKCRELQWERDELPGYKTLGKVRLHPREVAPWLEQAERLTGIKRTLLETMIKFESGYRTGVIRDDGAVGIMQIPGKVARRYGLRNPFDGEANVLAGARYLRDLIDEYGDEAKALAVYRGGRKAVGPDGYITRKPRVLWFVREVLRVHKALNEEFPAELGAENIAFVLTWLE